MSALRLCYVDFAVVEFTLLDEDGYELRPVVVRVGSGTSWWRAVVFPCVGTAASESTGDPELDQEVRERAAEELVRLEAALRVAHGESAA